VFVTNTVFGYVIMGPVVWVSVVVVVVVLVDRCAVCGGSPRYTKALQRTAAKPKLNTTTMMALMVCNKLIT